MTVNTLHFSVDAEGLTRIVRDLWREGRCAYSIKVLQGIGLTLEQSFSVIDGSNKFVNRTGGTVLLVEDGSPQEYVIEPTLESLFSRLNEFETKEEKLCIIYEDPDDYHVPYDESFDAMYEDIKKEDDQDVYREKVSSNIDPLKHSWLSDPDPDMTEDNGWLLRDGTFYPCEYGHHQALAKLLFPNVNNPEREAEKAGYVKLARGGIFDRALFWPGDSMRKPTKRQISKVIKWAKNHNLPDIVDEWKDWENKWKN